MGFECLVEKNLDINFLSLKPISVLRMSYMRDIVER